MSVPGKVPNDDDDDDDDDDELALTYEEHVGRRRLWFSGPQVSSQKQILGLVKGAAVVVLIKWLVAVGLGLVLSGGIPTSKREDRISVVETSQNPMPSLLQSVAPQVGLELSKISIPRWILLINQCLCFIEEAVKFISPVEMRARLEKLPELQQLLSRRKGV
ncbi:hypothetical protein PoB_000264500 [Plakobranchus ocellatus]|uniref:Uncharacterized protein n=1 Tax=Plakobranchus ocellatus TaxID=259542 RepID=A0AAV3XZQ0_9GAST|nr:hypothetical protein PoB_000264500 [Plakobranchus ocellatus]